MYTGRICKVFQKSPALTKNSKDGIDFIFFVGYLLLDMEPTLKSGLCPQWDFVDKTNLSFANDCQLELASGL